MDDEPEHEQEAFVLQDDLCEDDILETLAAENDEDAILVMQFEDSISETIQSDSELAAYYSNYQEARRRLSERVKVRGFWPINRRSDKGFGKKGKGKGKGKSPFSGPGSLARRIANSFCRICMQKGHWKNECPQRAGGNSSSSNSNPAANVAPTSVVIAEEVPEEIAHFTIVDDQDPQAEQACFGVMTSQGGNRRTGDNRGKIMMDKLQFAERFHLQWKRHDRTKKSSEARVPIRSELEQQSLTPAPACPESEHMSLKPLHPSEAAVDTQICDVHFATAGTVGIVDLGASQTVIGDAQVKELIQNLPERIQSQIQRTTCNLTFRFGNQQTLTSRHALLLPLGHAKFRIAIVPGKTPFLLSSSFLKGIKAVIDTDTGVLWSKSLNKELMVSQSSKNLFLMDISQLWQGPNEEPTVQKSSATGFTCLQVPIQNTVSSPMPESSESASPGLSPEKVNQVTGEDSCQEIQDPAGSMTESANNRNHMTMHGRPHDAPHSFSQPSSSLCEADAQHISDVHHVQRGHQVDSVSRGAEEDRVQGRAGTHPGDDPGAIGQRTHCVRQGQDGTDVSRSVRGPIMDRLVHSSLREKPEASAPDVCPVRPEASGSRDRPGYEQEPDQEIREDEGVPSHRLGRLRCVGSDLRTGSSGDLLRNASSGQDSTGGGTSGKSLHGEQAVGESHHEHGDGHAGGSHACTSTECESRAVESACSADVHVHDRDVDLDFDFTPNQGHNSFKARIQRDVRKFSKELHDIVIQVRSKPRCQQPRLDLLEVMCSGESELTKQMQRLGGKAQRFGRLQGDLNTVEGRRRLFTILATQQPKHVWVSPECGPWCQWSQFNMNRSLKGWEQVMNKREQQLWQISLAVVLYRFQKEHHNHFDLEQPRGSALMKTPGMHEILQGTLWNEFDMCKVGDLRDPQTHDPIRKRMAVCSTSVDMHVALHGKMCNGEHHHRNIAGNTKIHGVTVKLSQFTELYPQKFAKQVAKIMLHDQGQRCYAMVGETIDDHPTKRRRLGSKLSPQAIAERFAEPPEATITWLSAMKVADRTAPRVGTQVVEAGELFEQVQSLCPQHHVRHIVLCRGTDRYVGPNRAIPPGFAPLRRQVCIKRRSEDLHVDDWEAWENLSQRGLRRKGQSARVSMTVFASVKEPEVPSSAVPVHTGDGSVSPSSHRRPLETKGASQPPAAKRMHHNPTGNGPETASTTPRPQNLDATPNADINLKPHHNNPELNNHNLHPISNPDDNGRNNSEVSHESSERTAETETSEVPHQIVDLASQKHGPEFLQLDRDEQSWLLKLHRNLGHPGHAKLTEFCRQLQCPERILKAIRDIQCSVCQESRGPVISRPSAIHEPCDFGDVVSMDGITWTNSQGSQFHFYHFLDQSTMFNTAVVSPGHTTDHACRALLTGWFNWAGPPNLLCVDAATELNSDEFSSFLQRHSVKCRTCAAEAHWQNARTERHGGILQLMLNKVDPEQPITTYEQMSAALSHVTSTKNQWSRHRGFPPEMLVFGKGVRVPGSVTSDPTVAAHAAALSNQPDGMRFRQDLALRESARKAFAMVDNDQTLRRAIVQRSRPHRGFYEKGEWVMMWKKKGEAEGSWIGPLQVIIQEGQNTVWVTRHHKLYRIAPEHLRSLTAMEEHRYQPSSTAIESRDQSSIRPAHGGVQFHDMMPPQPVDDSQGQNHAIPSASMPEVEPSVTLQAPMSSSPSGQNVPESPHDQPDTEPEIVSIPSENPNDNSNHTTTENTPAFEIPGLKHQMRKMVYMPKNIQSILFMKNKLSVLKLTSIKKISISGRKKSVHLKWLSWYQLQNASAVK